MPIPEPLESEAVAQSENKPVSYNVITGEEIVHETPLTTKEEIPISGWVTGGMGGGIISQEKIREEGTIEKEYGPWPVNFSDLTLITNPEDYPWRVNVKLYMTFDSGSYVGSGVLIDPMHVLTAGHCVHEANSGGTWATSIVVVPAYEDGWRPYGDASAVSLHSWTGWTDYADFDHDMGVIDLDRPIGSLTSWHGYGYNDDPDFYTDNTFHSAGYPAETPCNGQYMYYWYGPFDFTDSLLGIWYGNEVGFNKRAYGGQSGSGVYNIDSGNRYVYAVVSNTVKVPEGPTKCPRITSDKFEHIRDDFIANDTPTTFDLIPLDVTSLPSSIMAGDQLSSMSYLVHNYSSTSWGGTVNVDVYLSTNDNISTADTHIQSHSFTWNLKPKNSVRVEVASPPTVPIDTTGGGYYIGVILDISDYDSGNNDSDGQDASPISVGEPSQPPSKATSPGPDNGATGVSINKNLSWSDGGGATSFDVYFGTNSTPDSGELKGNQTSFSYNPGTLDYSTTYYWRIDAKNSDGTTTGDVWYFTTATDTSPPDTSITNGPSGTITYNDVTFTYTGSDNVTSTSNLVYSYKLDGYGSDWSSYTSSTSKSYNDLPNGSYTFYVKAKDEAGNVDSSPASRSFTVNCSATLSYITISGSTQVNENSGAQYTCTAYYSDGSNSNVTSSASWIENSSYASISSSGYLTTSSVSSDQSCTITATYGGKSDTHNITIKNVFGGGGKAMPWLQLLLLGD